MNVHVEVVGDNDQFKPVATILFDSPPEGVLPVTLEEQAVAYRVVLIEDDVGGAECSGVKKEDDIQYGNSSEHQPIPVHAVHRLSHARSTVPEPRLDLEFIVRRYHNSVRKRNLDRLPRY